MCGQSKCGYVVSPVSRPFDHPCVLGSAHVISFQASWFNNHLAKCFIITEAYSIVHAISSKNFPHSKLRVLILTVRKTLQGKVWKKVRVVSISYLLSRRRVHNNALDEWIIRYWNRSSRLSDEPQNTGTLMELRARRMDQGFFNIDRLKYSHRLWGLWKAPGIWAWLPSVISWII